MRGLLTTLLLLSAVSTAVQISAAQTPESPASSSASTSSAEEFPDAPGVPQHGQDDVVAVAQASFKVTGDGVKTCNAFRAMKVVYVNPRKFEVRKPCSELIYPYQRFLTTDVVIPLTWQQKGYIALHDLTDPANFGTILGISAISVGSNAHSAYGPGMKGFGKAVGVSLLQDAQGQFFGAFAIPVIAHQDPRYYRMPHAKLTRRILYSVSRTFVSRHDDGTPMPNYAALLNYPIGAAISNLYVPGINSDAASTFDRIATGIATDPANNLLTEFLPDVASRVHVRIIFVQNLLNHITSSSNGVTLQ